MEWLSDEERSLIADKLKERGAIIPCSRCHRSNFTVLDAYFVMPISNDMSVTQLGGRSLPLAVIVCDHCGYTVCHALGSLGLLKKPEEKHDK
ncbi:MAG: hypothetical protein E3J72_17460 [Planctomycetota bacterium]|nr:MAG: hypothetical protein E3J72_17460 [Planctomycetota bacterium]